MERSVSDRAEYLGSGLIHQGLMPNPDTFTGIFAQNRPEWIIGELACYTYSMVAVPLYDTLGPDTLVFIIDQAEISTVICDKQTRAEILLQNQEKGQMPVLKTIVIMDSFDPELFERGAIAQGKENLQKPVPPKPEDLSIIYLTSGTAGNPKGVILTHENVVVDAASVLKSFEVKDVHLQPEQFTIENGLLTPTLKAKSAELKVLFQPQIDKLYASIQ